MPAIPAAIMAASAKYGFTYPPGTLFSKRSENDDPVMADAKDSQGLSALGKSFIAGQLKYMREMTLFFAPNINSYKRYVEGSFAPTAMKWGRDNRTCAIRLVGSGHSLRFENRVPGGDVNPYLAEAAMNVNDIP